jgi:hypothetical protein
MLIRLRNPCSAPWPKQAGGVRNKSFNLAHGIIPRGVSKKIKDIIDGVYDSASVQTELKAAQQQAAYDAMDEKTVAREIKRLEKRCSSVRKTWNSKKRRRPATNCSGSGNGYSVRPARP